MKRSKKLFICLAIISILMTGCGKPYDEESTNYKKELNNNYFVEINRFDSFDEGASISYRIVYAKDTKVKYLLALGYYRFSITPLFNADGSLQIYEE